MLYIGAKRSLLKQGSNSAPAWTPAANFSSGELGLWYDFSTLTGLYQDSAGTSPATATGQPNGLMLDKRLGLVLGTELLSIRANRDFSSDTGYWVKSADATISGGTLNLSSASTFAGIGKNVPLRQYTGYYEVVFTVSSISSGSVAPRLGGNFGVAVTAPGTYTQRVCCGAQNSELTLVAASNGTTATIDDFSVKEILGNHISQATASARPIIGAAGAIQYTTFDGLDDSMNTGAITLGADMDCFIAVKRSSATGILLYTTSGSGVYLGAIDATAGAASAGAGTPTYAVNGVDVAGGTGTTRTQLAAAIPIGLWVVLEIRNANLSAWATLAMGAYTGFPMGMNFAQGIVCPAGDATTRTKNRQFAGAKAGLSL